MLFAMVKVKYLSTIRIVLIHPIPYPFRSIGYKNRRKPRRYNFQYFIKKCFMMPQMSYIERGTQLIAILGYAGKGRFHCQLSISFIPYYGFEGGVIRQIAVYLRSKL